MDCKKVSQWLVQEIFNLFFIFINGLLFKKKKEKKV